MRDVAGRDLLQLQWHFGLDTLSWIRSDCRGPATPCKRSLPVGKTLRYSSRLDAAEADDLGRAPPRPEDTAAVVAVVVDHRGVTHLLRLEPDP